MTIEAGQQLLHYRLIEKIGEGGMGVVWKAIDSKLDREVAIKVLPETFSADIDRLARFEREAKLLASLNHPGIAAVYGLHEVADPDTQEATDSRRIRFIAMELVAGRGPGGSGCNAPWLTLPDEDSAIPRLPRLPEALEAAHERGVIHRDLKPANMQCSRRKARPRCSTSAWPRRWHGEPAGGFGSKDHLSPTVTSLPEQWPASCWAPPPYMSPEQARGNPVDAR